MTSVFVGLGANICDERTNLAATLDTALDFIDKSYPVSVARVSAFWRTPAFPVGSGPDFINAAAEIRTPEGAADVLAILHDVERRMGRTRPVRWGPRVLDLDLLTFGEVVLPDAATVRHWMDLSPEQASTKAPDQVILPHPRLHERAFVLVPLAEIARDWRHPLLGQTVKEMRDALPKASLEEVVPWA